MNFIKSIYALLKQGLISFAQDMEDYLKPRSRMKHPPKTPRPDTKPVGQMIDMLGACESISKYPDETYTEFRSRVKEKINEEKLSKEK